MQGLIGMREGGARWRLRDRNVTGVITVARWLVAGTSIGLHIRGACDERPATRTTGECATREKDEEHDTTARLKMVVG